MAGASAGGIEMVETVETDVLGVFGVADACGCFRGKWLFFCFWLVALLLRGCLSQCEVSLK